MIPQKILVAYDGSAPSKKAIDLAKEICEREPGTELVLVHALNVPSSMDSSGIQDAIVKEANRVSEELRQIAETIPNKTEVKLLKGSSPAKLIIDCAVDEKCNLIVMGSRGRGGFKGYLGSVSHTVVQGSPIDVLIAKRTDDAE